MGFLDINKIYKRTCLSDFDHLFHVLESHFKLEEKNELIKVTENSFCKSNFLLQTKFLKYFYLNSCLFLNQ